MTKTTFLEIKFYFSHNSMLSIRHTNETLLNAMVLVTEYCTLIF